MVKLIKKDVAAYLDRYRILVLICTGRHKLFLNKTHPKTFKAKKFSDIEVGGFFTVPKETNGLIIITDSI